MKENYYMKLQQLLMRVYLFSSSRKSQQLESCRSRHRGPIGIYLSTRLMWSGLVNIELFLYVFLSLTDSDRKEGAWHAFLAQREMFALKAEHSGSHISHQAHEQHI